MTLYTRCEYFKGFYTGTYVEIFAGEGVELFLPLRIINVIIILLYKILFFLNLLKCRQKKG